MLANWLSGEALRRIEILVSHQCMLPVVKSKDKQEICVTAVWWVVLK